MILECMAKFHVDNLSGTCLEDLIKNDLILRAKQGSDKFGWGEKDDLIMSDRYAYRDEIELPRSCPGVIEYVKTSGAGVLDSRVEVFMKYEYVGPKLRDDQIEGVEQSYKHLTNTDGWKKFFSGGIIVAPPGVGKTIMALNLIAKLGQKALIIVH